MSHPSQTKTITKPPTFQDSEGRTWTIKLTGDLIDAVLEKTQVDLVPDDFNFDPVVNLCLSHRKLGPVLWACVESQAASQGATREQFMKACDASTLKDGWRGLLDAITFFIRSLMGEEREKHAVAIIEKSLEVIELQCRTATEVILSKATDEALLEAANQVKQQLEKDLISELENSAASLEPLSASTGSRFR